ncbi:DnaA/Hda family protein [Methylocapsa palsarum]|uniref:DnaA protein n=1 Tax=Methylocapsa palsarum TaxID=1612308 RepID=A0A1I3XH42_9HYPH|nr:DnaA/Hda family protein [Methylocapsa palsarum]SFK18391.1 dnaA protein [Methylocapsa palsarum]
MVRPRSIGSGSSGGQSRQLALELAGEPAFGADDFLVSPTNEKACAMIDLWPDWPDPVLLILGQRGAGKSHLGAIWAGRAGAGIVEARALAAQDVAAIATRGPLLVEDMEAFAAAGRGDAEAALFHLMNLMRERGAALAMTAVSPPDAWGLQTPDLLSRLRLATAVEIGLPDDALMRAVLVKLLIDRQLVIDASVVEYAALRLDRSLGAARAFIDALDREAFARKQRVTRKMAAEILDAMADEE